MILQLPLVALLAIAAAAAPQPVSGGGHQLLCAQPVGGFVSSSSSSYQLRAVLDWPAAGSVHQSQNYRLIHGCNAASFNKSYFDALFHDRFEP
jgi:hypothetical protein